MWKSEFDGSRGDQGGADVESEAGYCGTRGLHRVEEFADKEFAV